MKLQGLSKRPNANKKTVLILGLIFLFCLGIFILHIKGYRLLDIKRLFTGKVSTSSKVLAKFNIDLNKKPIYTVFEDKVIETTKDGIKAYNINNKQEWEIKFNLTNPLILMKNKYLLAADEGGRTITLYQNTKKVWSKTTEGQILNTKLNKNGYSLVLCQNGNGREILVYSPGGVIIFKKTYEKQDFLINADLSENKKVAALCINTQRSQVGSKVDYFDLKGTLDSNSTPVWGVVKEDVLATDIKIFSNGNVVLTGDNSVFALNTTGALKWIKEFNNTKVYKANIASGNYIVLETNSKSKSNFIENKGRQIEVINGDGQQDGQEVKVRSIVNMDVFDDYFIINDGSKLYSISKGKLIFSCPLEKDIKYIKGFSGKSQVLLVGKDFAEVIEIK